MKRFRIIVRPRFTLWAMLVLVTVVAIPLGYVAQRRAWNEERSAAVKLFKSRGAHILGDSPTSFLPSAVNGVSSQTRRWWDTICNEGETPALKYITWSDGVSEDEVRRLHYFP